MPEVGKLILRKGMTPDLAEEKSPNTEMGADFCVQMKPGLSDKITVSMMETQLLRDKNYPSFVTSWESALLLVAWVINDRPLGDAQNPRDRMTPC